ncbi:MAG: hypothetical protein ABI333_20845 [bacterium]
MSERKKREAEVAMARLLVDDVEQFERMLAEGHRPLCIEYQPLVPAIVDAAVFGRQLGPELKEAREYLAECPLCAESLDASSRALREIQDELDDAADGDPPGPPRPAPPPSESAPEPGPWGRWWRRWTRTRTGVLLGLAVVLGCVALMGLVIHFGRQCAVSKRAAERADAAVPLPGGDAGAPSTLPDAAVDPRSWLRKKGSLAFVFKLLDLIEQRRVRMETELVGVEADLERWRSAGMAPKEGRARAAGILAGLRTRLTHTSRALKQADDFVRQVKGDGRPAFKRQHVLAYKELAAATKAHAAITVRAALAERRLKRAR